MSIDTGRQAINTLALAAGARAAPDRIEDVGNAPFPFSFCYVSAIESDNMVDRLIVTYSVQFHANGEQTGRSMETLATIGTAFLTALAATVNITLGGAVTHLILPATAKFGPSAWAGVATYACVVEVKAKVLL